jgi:hypothetical protein
LRRVNIFYLILPGTPVPALAGPAAVVNSNVFRPPVLKVNTVWVAFVTQTVFTLSTGGLKTLLFTTAAGPANAGTGVPWVTNAKPTPN